MDAGYSLLSARGDVSRETLSQLEDYVALLMKWNATINLVSKSSVDLVWSRHIIDSLQAFQFGSDADHWVDMGSGGGLPGLVVAILALEKAPQMVVTLVESDQRKAAFLRHVSQKMGLKTTIISERAESIAPLGADTVSARALAPLPLLCSLAMHHLKPTGRAVFLKGKTAGSEIAEAKKVWQFTMQSYPSVTDPSAVVLVLKGLSHV